MTPPTTVFACRKCKKFRSLVRDLEALDQVEVQEVRCQDICKGAVAGVEVEGSITWFRRIRGPKDRAAMAKLVGRGGRGPVPKRLRDHVVARRQGRPPRH